MYLAKNLKYFRLKHNFSQNYIAKKLGYKSYTTIQKWETGVSEPSLEKLNILSQLYNVDMDTLYSVDLEAGYKPVGDKKVNKVPLLGIIAAGQPILAEQNIQDYFNIDYSVKADFALKVKGDSMKDINILPGDIVFIKKQYELENGEIGAFLIEKEATLKRFYKKKDMVILQAENDNYEPIIISKGYFKILGKLVATLRISN